MKHRLWRELRIALSCLAAGFILFVLGDTAGLLWREVYNARNGYMPMTHAERSWTIDFVHCDNLGWAIFFAPLAFVTVFRLLRYAWRSL